MMIDVVVWCILVRLSTMPKRSKVAVLPLSSKATITLGGHRSRGRDSLQRFRPFRRSTIQSLSSLRSRANSFRAKTVAGTSQMYFVSQIPRPQGSTTYARRSEDIGLREHVVQNSGIQRRISHLIILEDHSCKRTLFDQCRIRIVFDND